MGEQHGAVRSRGRRGARAAAGLEVGRHGRLRGPVVARDGGRPRGEGQPRIVEADVDVAGPGDGDALRARVVKKGRGLAVGSHEQEGGVAAEGVAHSLEGDRGLQHLAEKAGHVDDRGRGAGGERVVDRDRGRVGEGGGDPRGDDEGGAAGRRVEAGVARVAHVDRMRPRDEPSGGEARGEGPGSRIDDGTLGDALKGDVDGSRRYGGPREQRAPEDARGLAHRNSGRGQGEGGAALDYGQAARGRAAAERNVGRVDGEKRVSADRQGREGERRGPARQGLGQGGSAVDRQRDVAGGRAREGGHGHGDRGIGEGRRGRGDAGRGGAEGDVDREGAAGGGRVVGRVSPEAVGDRVGPGTERTRVERRAEEARDRIDGGALRHPVHGNVDAARRDQGTRGGNGAVEEGGRAGEADGGRGEAAQRGGGEAGRNFPDPAPVGGHTQGARGPVQGHVEDRYAGQPRAVGGPGRAAVDRVVDADVGTGEKVARVARVDDEGVDGRIGDAAVGGGPGGNPGGEQGAREVRRLVDLGTPRGGAAIRGERDVGDVDVVGIDHRARNEAPRLAGHGGAQGPGAGDLGESDATVRGSEHLAEAHTHEPHVVVLRRDADSTDRDPALNGALAGQDHGRALVGRAEEPVRPEVDRVGGARPEGHGREEEDRGGGGRAVEAVGARRESAPEERPIVLEGIRRTRDPPVPHGGRLVEVGVVHRHVVGVGGTLVDEGEAAVAEVGPGPRAVCPLPLGAVVLGAADHELTVDGVQGEALELGGVEAGVVEARPGEAGVGRLPDPAVVGLVDDGGIRGRGHDGVGVGVQAHVRLHERRGAVG